MSRLSISAAWDETRAFLTRESRLVVPVALAFNVLPAVAGAMVAPAAMSLTVPRPGMFAVALAVTVARLLGLMVITRLALGTRDRLAATIGAAARRLPPLLALIMLVVLAASVVAAPLMLPLVQSPADPPAGARLGLAAVGLLMLALFARLSLSVAVAVCGPGGPLAIARKSLALTRGNFWRLLGTILLLLVTMAILGKVAQLVVGSLVVMAFGRPGAWTVSRLLILLAMQLVEVAVSVVLFVLLARLYAQRVLATHVPSSGS